MSFIAAHFLSGQAESSDFVLAATTHPHSLQTPNDILSHCLQIAKRSSNSFLYFISDILSKIKDKFILVQFAGGQSPLDLPQDGDWTKKPYDYENEPLKRHYPIDKAQKFVDEFKKANPDVAVIQYALPNEPQIDKCEHFVVPYLVYYTLSKSDRCLGAFTIDSSLAHLITGNTKVMTVWGHSLPEHFGYCCNKNVIQKCRRNDTLYFSLLGPSGAKIDYIEPEVAVKDFVEYIKEA